MIKEMFTKRIVGITLALTMLFSNTVYADVENAVGDFEDTIEPNIETSDASDDYAVDTPETQDMEHDSDDYDLPTEEELESFDVDYVGETVNDGTFKGTINPDGETVTITGFVKNDIEKKDIIIPGVIDGKTVTVIGDNAFANSRHGYNDNYNGLIGSLTIPDSVKTIGEFAFAYNYDVDCLKLGDGLKTIGEGAFKTCTNIKGVLRIPDEVETIGDYAFEECGINGLPSLTIGNNVATIGDSAFFNSGITGNVTIPYGVTSIGGSVFEYCGGLTKVINQSSCAVDLPTYGEKWRNASSGEEDIKVLPGGQTAIRSGYNEEPDPQKDNEFQFWSTWDNEEFCEFNNPDWSWFFQPSSEYEHDLARLSIRVAMAAFTNPPKKWAQSAIKTSSKHIEDFMRKPGIGMKDIYVNYPRPIKTDQNYVYNTIGYAIGNREITNKKGSDKANLIMIAVRGANYENEWGNNFYVKDKTKKADNDHAGFNLAAQGVVEGLKNYLNNHPEIDLSTSKIWISGYSRAAATSNLVAQKLIDNGIDGKKPSPDNVFAFCFECPANTSASKDNPTKFRDPKYNGIYNIVNPIDFVPLVAMNNGNGWRYCRYGRTLVIPSALTDKSLNYLFYSMVVDEKFKNDNSIKWDSDDGKRRANKTLAYLWGYDNKLVGAQNHKLIQELANQTGNPVNYLNNYQDSFVETVGVGVLSPGGEFKFMDILNAFKDAGVIIPALPDIRIWGVWNFKSVHYPELCFAWMEALSGNQLFDVDRYYRVISIEAEYVKEKKNQNHSLGQFNEEQPNYLAASNLPLPTLLVYDSGNNLVGKVVNGVAEDFPEGIYVCVDNNGQVLIFAPGDEIYKIVAESKEDIQISCTVKEINAADETPERAVVYSNITVNSGEKANINIGEVEKSQDTKYSATDGKNTTVSPVTDKKGSDIEYCTVDITEAPNGTTYGAGSYIKNQQVTVVATPNAGYRFKCWKSGNQTVSDKAYYSFKVTANVSLTPVFEKGDEKVLVKSIKINPSSKTLKKGKTVTLKANITPDNATNKAVTWKSSNTKVAKVNSKGKVTAVAPGTAKITATAKDGSGKKATATIKVKGIALNGKNLTVQKGRTSKTIKVTIISDKIKSVTSSNENVATVKLKGKTLQVTGKNTGKAIITVKAKSGMKATLKVTVQKDKVTTKTLKVSKSSVKLDGKGKTATIKVTATPDQLSTKEKIKVTNNNKKIASFKINQNTDEIKITAKEKGTCKLTVKVGKKTKKITVKVTK